MTTLDGNTKIPIAVGLTVIMALVVPLTLYFSSTRVLAVDASSGIDRHEAVLAAIIKDQSDMKADIREIKTILSERRKR